MSQAVGQFRMRDLLLFTAIFCGILNPWPAAQAALGSAENSIDGDRQAVASAIEHGRTQRGAYAVREFGNKSLTVREYISQATGKVFAVVWSGRNHPPLSTMLGPYLEEYRAASQPIREQPRGKYRMRTARANLTTDNLVIERGGKFGTLAGRIYIRGQLPKEVKIDEIQ